MADDQSMTHKWRGGYGCWPSKRVDRRHDGGCARGWDRFLHNTGSPQRQRLSSSTPFVLQLRIAILRRLKTDWLPSAPSLDLKSLDKQWIEMVLPA